MKKSQLYSQNQQKILSHFLQPIPKSKGSQMLQTIKNNQHFHQICQTIAWIFSDLPEPPITLDKDYVYMNALMKLSDQRNNISIQKLSKSVDQLQQLQMKLDCLIQQLSNKTNWIKNKSNQINKNRQQSIQDCQILAHQNSKLSIQYQTTQKQNKNIQNSNIKGQPNKNQTKQLSLIFDKYKCKGNFPKNKNDALRLLNNLQVMVQKLEVQKLSLQ